MPTGAHGPERKKKKKMQRTHHHERQRPRHNIKRKSETKKQPEAHGGNQIEEKQNKYTEYDSSSRTTQGYKENQEYNTSTQQNRKETDPHVTPKRATVLTIYNAMLNTGYFLTIALKQTRQ